VCDSSNDHDVCVVVDGVYDPIIADANPIIVASG